MEENNDVMNYDDERYKTNFIKAKTFFNKQIPVHLLKKDREWYNGLITEISNDFFIIDEMKLGKRVVFFLEIWEIEEYGGWEK